MTEMLILECKEGFEKKSRTAEKCMTEMLILECKEGIGKKSLKERSKVARARSK